MFREDARAAVNSYSVELGAGKLLRVFHDTGEPP